MKMKIPEMMKAVQLEKEGGPLVVKTVAVPKPKRGEVLVRMAAAPVNPSDLQRVRSIKDAVALQSFIPGIEGSGTVIASGGGLLPLLWSGKRVACSSFYPESGTWAEFMVTSASYCFPLPSGISDEQGSMLLVNPMTAVAFFDIILKGKHKAIVNSAAAGALGGMIRFLGKRYNVHVINVVRNEQQAQLLTADGAEYVLNNTGADFAGRLRSLTHELKATLALDPVSGHYTQELLEALPYGGKIILYGNLSGSDEGTALRPLLLDNKKIEGFYLVNWLKDNDNLRAILNLIKVRSMMKNNIKVTIQQRLPLESVQFGIDAYLNNMTGGKVLLIPRFK